MEGNVGYSTMIGSQPHNCHAKSLEQGVER